MEPILTHAEHACMYILYMVEVAVTCTCIIYIGKCIIMESSIVLSF